MRKILGTISSFLPFVIFAAPAFAQTPINACPTGTQFGALCNESANNFGSIIGTLITAAFVIAIIIALGYLIYGGIKWILSEGDKGKVEESRNHVIAAVIGLIVVFLSYFILNLVIGIFIGQGVSLNNLQFPSLNPGH